MTAMPAEAAPLAERIVAKIPFWDKLQAIVYSGAVSFWAVGVVAAGYVLVTQAKYFGKSFKYTWDHLNLLWHVHAVPWAGPWLYDHYDTARHIFGRNALESTLAYAFVAMIVPLLVTRQRDKPPLLDKIMVRLGMPSPYQGDLGRHPRTSVLQYLFLPVSMYVAAIPGFILAGLLLFGGMAILHHYGLALWFTPTSWYVATLIGIAGGRLAGHKPAVKAGLDINRFFLGKRLAISYLADAILVKFAEKLISQEQARNELTAMRRTDPGKFYPYSYRLRYQTLLEAHAPVRHYSRWNTVAIIAIVASLVVLGAYGLYVLHYGVKHGYWKPDF